jgi:hypothetical protein
MSSLEVVQDDVANAVIARYCAILDILVQEQRASNETGLVLDCAQYLQHVSHICVQPETHTDNFNSLGSLIAAGVLQMRGVSSDSEVLSRISLILCRFVDGQDGNGSSSLRV